VCGSPARRQRAAEPIACQCDSDRPRIDAHRDADPADALSGLGGDMLQQRHVLAEIAALGHPSGERSWRRDRDQRVNNRITVRLDPVETERRAGAGVPDDARQRVGDRDGGEGNGESRSGNRRHAHVEARVIPRSPGV
jgi:hypothetical protein